MNGFREACIINRPEESTNATSIQDFFKWIGVSYFTLISEDVDIYQNPILKNNRENLDITIYLKGKELTFYNWSSKHIEETLTIDECLDTSKKKVSFILTKLYKRIMEVESDAIFEKLISVYEQKNLAAELANIKYSLRMHSNYEENIELDYAKQKKLWEDIVVELERFQKLDFQANEEYLIHAIVYSKRKVNEICNLLHETRKYATVDLLQEVDEIYAYDENFYEAECLKAKIVMLDSEYRLMSILYLQSCIEQCRVDACKSFYYYRLGKKYEMLDRKDQQMESYEKAYEMNPANFRALFKLGVHYINVKDFEKAEKYFTDILKLLYDDHVQEEGIQDCIKNLSAIELEYASKSYILLAKIALRDEQGILFVKHLYNKAIEIGKSLDDNIYLKEMYPDEKQREVIKKCLEKKLALENIKAKLRNIGDTLAR